MRKLNPVTLDYLKYGFQNGTRTRLIEKDEPDKGRVPSMVFAGILFLIFMIRLLVQGA